MTSPEVQTNGEGTAMSSTAEERVLAEWLLHNFGSETATQEDGSKVTVEVDPPTLAQALVAAGYRKERVGVSESVATDMSKTMAAEVEPLLEYAATADIAGDPLVIDLATALTRATNKLTDIQELMQQFRNGAFSGDVLVGIDTSLHEIAA